MHVIESGVDGAKDLVRRGAADAAMGALRSAEVADRSLAGEAPAPILKTLVNGFFGKVNSDSYSFIRGNIAKVARRALVGTSSMSER